MDENELSERIKKLDFSRYSQKHKEQLWQELNTRSRRPLLEHELEFAAAGVAELKQCPACGSENTSGDGTKCGDCGRTIPKKF